MKAILNHIPKSQADYEYDISVLNIRISDLEMKAKAGWEACAKMCDEIEKSSKRVPVAVLVIAGQALQQLGQHEKACEHFETILSSHPDHVLSLNRAAVSMLALGHKSEAIMLLKDAIKHGPGFTSSYRILANIFSENGEIDKAINILNIALSANPDDPLLQKDRKTLEDFCGRQS